MRRAAPGLLAAGLVIAVVFALVARRPAGGPPAAPGTTLSAPPSLPSFPLPSGAAFPPGGYAAVRDAVDAYVAANGLEARVTAADRRELIGALARVRRSGRLQQRVRIPRPGLERRHLRNVQEADRLFREKLGIGVAQFIAAQGAQGQVEDLGR